MYIKITNIDFETKTLCTDAPMRTGPSLPDIKDFVFIFSNESTFPIPLNTDGSYTRLPLYYGICSEDSDISVNGVIGTLTEDEFNAIKVAEHLARRPYPSWVGDINTMSWKPPVNYPIVPQYQWDEPTVSWVLVNAQSAPSA
jgi:hypothetical protein